MAAEFAMLGSGEMFSKELECEALMQRRRSTARGHQLHAHFQEQFRVKQWVGDLCQIPWDHEQGGASLKDVVTNEFATHKIVSLVDKAVRGLQRSELFQKASRHVLPSPDGIEHLIVRARCFHELGLLCNKVEHDIIPDDPLDAHDADMPEAAMAEPGDEWLHLQEELEGDEAASLAPIEPAPSVGLETEAAAMASEGPLTEADAAVSEVSGALAPPPTATLARW